MIFNFLSSSSVVENTEQSPFNLTDLVKKIVEWCITDGIKLLIGIVVLLILFAIVNLIAKSVRKGMERKKRDITITKLVYNLIKKGVKVVLFIVFLGYVGIDTAGIGSIIASCAVAVGLALQGSLANIAGWVIIIVMRPFRIGDYIDCQGVSGTVEDIHLFQTYLRTPDNKVVIVPNGPLANGNIINYSLKDTRRVDLVFAISYEDDTNKAIALLNNVASNHEKVLKNEPVFVRLSECASSSINISCRVWVKTEDYWDVYFDLLQQGKDILQENNITIPFNQVSVHIEQK